MASRAHRSAPIGNVRGTLSELALRALLDHDLSTTGVVADRGGKISRRHYAQLFGCSRSALTRFISTFAEYECDCGIATGPLRHLKEMREWLHTSYEAGELEIRDGKVDRTAFQKHFNLRGGTFITRHLPIRQLFDEFDARVEQERYLPVARQHEFDRVLEVLAGRPELNKDRLTVNQVKLAKTTNVPQLRFRDKLFADAIVACQAKIAAEAMTSRIDPYLHGRVFPFSGLVSLWSAAFLERVGVRFKLVAAGFAAQSLKPAYLQLVNALQWIGVSNDPHCRAVVDDAAECGRISSVDDWEESLFGYRAHLVAGIAEGTRKSSSVDSDIKALRRMLDALSSGNVVPTTSIPLPSVKHARRLSGHLRSVAEAASRDLDDEKSDYVAFARDRFVEACKDFGTDMGRGESQEFVDGMAIELRSISNLPKDPVEAVRLVLERRLGALRDRAAAIVTAAIEAHERGRELLSASEIDAASFEREYLGSELNLHERIQLVGGLFPSPKHSPPDQIEKGIANLLALIDQRHAGIPPFHGSSTTELYGQFFAKRYLDYGGLGAITRMLIPDSDAVGATLTLYLCESGANLSVGRTLDRECIEASDLEEHRRITGNKARAKGKPIIVDLPDGSPAVQAIDWLLAAGRRLEITADEEDRDRLFLMRIGGRVQLMTPHWFTNWFKNFAASTPGVEVVRLVPNMIRPSVLLHAALSNDGRLIAGMAIGQHGLLVTQGYQQKWPTRLLYDGNMRRFQAAFETLVMSGVEDAATRLGISVEQFEARLGDLRATGLGTFCKDQRGRPGEQGNTCSKVDCWNDCPHLLIVAEVEAIASLQLWQASLRLEQPDWERDRAERWDEVWLPWLCLTDVVEEKMTRGPLLKIWIAARTRAAVISAQSGFVPPKPW